MSVFRRRKKGKATRTGNDVTRYGREVQKGKPVVAAWFVGLQVDTLTIGLPPADLIVAEVEGRSC